MKISVIIPVYNAEKTIERCLDALINQSFKDFEVICVNDGSKDKSQELLNRYAQKDLRIKVFNQENSGPAKTRYNAIEKACGEYLMFCDIDDWYEPTMLEEMYSTIIDKKVDLVMCNANIIDLANGAIQKDVYKNYIKLKHFGSAIITPSSYKNINVLLWNKIFKKELLEKHGIFYPQKYEHDDAMFVHKYCLFAKNYYGLNKTLYNYVIGNAESIMGKVYTNTNKKNPYDFIYAWQDLFDYIKHNCIDETWCKIFYKEFYGVFSNFYKYLNPEQKKESFEIIKAFIRKNPELLINRHLNMIEKAADYKEFTKIISGEKLQEISWIEHIFSITNITEFKIIRIFWIKIKIRRKILN